MRRHLYPKRRPEPLGDFLRTFVGTPGAERHYRENVAKRREEDRLRMADPVEREAHRRAVERWKAGG